MAKASSSRQISEVAAAGLSTKTNRIGRADQNFDTLPPFLKSIDFGAVDRRRDALCFECHRETVDEGNIIARTGVEDIGLGLTTCRRRFGYRWRVEPESFRRGRGTPKIWKPHPFLRTKVLAHRKCKNYFHRRQRGAGLQRDPLLMESGLSRFMRQRKKFCHS